MTNEPRIAVGKRAYEFIEASFKGIGWNGKGVETDDEIAGILDVPIDSLTGLLRGDLTYLRHIRAETQSLLGPLVSAEQLEHYLPQVSQASS